MLPDASLSSVPVVSQMIWPKSLPVVGLESYDLGGIALNDPSRGLMVRGWRAYATETGEVWLGPIEGPYNLFQTFPGLTTLSMTFDQNMNPCLGFTQAGQAKLYWYDASVEGYTTTTIAGATWPNVVLDDKRPFAQFYNDILFCYIRDGNLCLRLQRDRYLIEYVLYPDINQTIISPRLTNMGMGVNSRVQFLVYGDFFPV